MKLFFRAPLRPSRSGEEVLRFAIEGAVIGVISGLSCVAVRLLFRLLQWAVTEHAGLLPTAAGMLSPWRRALTPALGGIAAVAVAYWAVRFTRRAQLTEYVEAVRLEDGRMALLPTVWRTLSSACSVATGAAIGREGSMIQFAAAAVSAAGQRLPWLALPLMQQVVCGVAAGVAAAYHAPLAGVLFALEIVAGRVTWRVAPAVVAAAFCGAAVSRAVLGPGPLFLPHGEAGWSLEGAAAAAIMAAVFGLLGPLYLGLIRSLWFARRLPVPLLWSGLAVGMLSLLATQVWGNGDAALLSILQGSVAVHTVLLILLLRVTATALCVGTGTVGGVFTPTLFTGAAAGLLLCSAVHGEHPLLFALVGMGSLLAATTHAPLMASLMTVELTGEWRLLPLFLLCNLIAWTVARALSRQSLYAIASDLPASIEEADRTQEAPGAPAFSGAEAAD